MLPFKALYAFTLCFRGGETTSSYHFTYFSSISFLTVDVNCFFLSSNCTHFLLCRCKDYGLTLPFFSLLYFISCYVIYIPPFITLQVLSLNVSDEEITKPHQISFFSQTSFLILHQRYPPRLPLYPSFLELLARKITYIHGLSTSPLPPDCLRRRPK